MSRVDDLMQVVMDVLEGSQPEAAMTPETKLSEIGIDSLELIEVTLVLEEKLPRSDLFDYVPELTNTIRDVAVEIEKRTKP